MSLPETPALAFDDFVIDFAGRRLLRGEEELALEPKAFAVLALLAAAPGQAFSRDEILDVVWGHRHVTPGVLNRVMTLLRHALGEDAHTPRYLHTLHGVGYRFDLPHPPETADTHADLAPAAEAPAVVARAGAIPQRRATDKTAGPDATRQRQANDDSRAVPLSVPASTRWFKRVALALALILAAAAGWYWFARPQKLAAPAPATPAPIASTPVLAVLPLRSLGDDPRGQDFADGLTEELIGLLARIEGLRVTSHTSSFRSRSSQAALPDVARRLGASHLLEGSVRQEGKHLRIALRLVNAADGRTLWSETYDRELRDIFAVQDSIARGVGDALSLKLGLQSGSAGPGEDPALYRRYLLARRHLETQPSSSETELYKSAPKAVAAELRALVTEHPDYARAWGGLAAMLWMMSARPESGRDALRSEAESAAAAALRLDPEQPDAHAVLAGQACREQRWRDCMVGSERAMRGAPSDGMWRTWHAKHLATMGYVEEAMRVQADTLLLDPLSPSAHQLQGRLLDTAGRHEEARRHLQLAGLPLVHTALFFNSVWRRDYTGARRLAEQLAPDTPWRTSNLRAIDALEDPHRLPALHAAIAKTEDDSSDLRVSYDFMRFLLPERDYARDIAGLDQVQRAGYASYQWIFWMPGETALRQHPAFQQYLRDSGLLAYWREHGWPDRCRSDGGEGAICD